MTHNVAELWAARDCLSYLQSDGLLPQHKAILIRGDSQLTINFMLRRYKPGQEFNATVRAMMNTCSNWRRSYKTSVQWEHVPRDHPKQSWADWIGRCARAANQDVNLWTLVSDVPDEGAPPKDLLAP